MTPSEYWDILNGVKLLTPDEEKALWRQNNEASREKLIEAHFPLALKVVRQLRFPPHLENDIISEACYGLICAVDSFDPGRGIPFAGYGAWRIRGAVLDYLRRYFHREGSIVAEGHDILTSICKSSDDTDDHYMINLMNTLFKSLSEKEAFMLRKLYLEGVSQRDLANFYNVTPSAICQQINSAFNKLKKLAASSKLAIDLAY